jgi:signal transduction histidine kinase/ligand-binding sensor domain-containing protein/CheY-like chemotaxis protein/HPt (histidine-containing phosphotransfer) domain-containing protein
MNYKLIILLLFIPLLMFSQDRLRFDKLSIDEELSHTTVHSMMQDDKGFVWIGTENGLNVYNGYDFEIFRPDSKKENSISDAVIKQVFQDSKNTIWIGTENGLSRYIPKHNHFITYYSNPENATSLTDNHIRKIIEDEYGHLWVATNNGICKIIEYNDTELKCIQYPHDANDKNSFVNPIIRGLFKDSKNRIWIGSDGGGMYKMVDISPDAKTEKFTHYQSNENNSNSIQSNRVNSFAEDSFGNIWFGTWGGGLHKLFVDADGNEKIITYQHDSKNSTSISSNRVTNIYVDSKNTVWVGTYNRGLCKAIIIQNSNKLTFDCYVNNPISKESLSHNTVYSFLEDKAKNMWFGTWGDGISLSNTRNNYFMLFNDKTGFEQDIFKEMWSVAADNNNNWWIGAWDGGLGRVKNLDPENDWSYEKSIEVFKHDKNNPNSISSNTITGLLHDSQDRLWATTWGEEVNLIENVSTSKKPRFKRLKVGDNSYFAFEDSKKVIWIGSREGLHQIVGSERKDFFSNKTQILTYKKEDANPNGLPVTGVKSMLEDKKGNIWIGTIDGGLARAKRSTFDEIQNPKDMVFDIFQNDEKDITSLNDNHILSLYEDSEGNIWIGTKNGLNRYNPSTNSFEYYNINTGHLINNTINGILEDKKGMLWLGTERGITWFDPKTKEYRHYDENDGLQGKIFSGGAIKDIDGHFFFGGESGLNIFKPRKVQKNPYLPQVVLTDLKLFNKSIKSGHSSFKETPFRDIQNITFNHFQNMLTFEFAALNFTNSEHNQYQYKLKGFDDDWRFINHQRSINFTNLNPGNYTLLVKGSNNDGLWSRIPYQLKIKVLPPFWATWWFRFLVVGLAIAAIFCFIQYRIQTTKQENQRLEKMVTERTQEIEKQKQLVEERSRYKEQFFSNVSHELRTPLNGIIGMSHLLKRTELNESQQQFANVVKDSAENLLVIVNDLLDISKINAGKLSLVPRPFETSRFFNHLYELLRPKAEQKNISLNFELSENLPQFIEGDSVRLYQILINLLGNSLKFTIDGSIHLMIEEKSRAEEEIVLQFEVVDTGIGIPKEKIENIFQTYSQVIDKEGYHYEGSGLGLTIVKNLVELQKGTIRVDSEYNEGTIFTVVLPFKIPTNVAIEKELEEKSTREFSKKWKDKEVLLIEDNPINLLYAKNLFADWNISVAVAKNLKEAIKLVSLSKFDVIIADVKLPDGNGLDLIRGIQRHKRHPNHETPIIVLSASESLNGHRPEDLNVVTYMIKPFLPEKLAGELDKIFSDSIGMPSAANDNIQDRTSDNGYLSDFRQKMKGNTKHMIAILEIFLEQLPDSIDKMETAINDEDWSTLNYQSHTIKSTVRTVGILELAKIASEIEIESDKDNPDLAFILGHFEEFKQKSQNELPRLKDEMEMLLSDKT